MKLPCRLVALAFLLAAIFSATGSQNATTMTIEAYAGITHDSPYVLGLCKGSGKLVYVGVRHSTDPHSGTVETVQEVWNSFAPDLVLIEGGAPPPPSPTLQDAVRLYAEAGAATFLARQRGVSVASLELPFGQEVAVLLEQYASEKVALFYALRLVAQERRRNGVDGLDEYLSARLIPWLIRQPGLEQVIASKPNVPALAAEYLPELTDWRAVPSEWFDPLPQSGSRFTNSIAQRLVQLRDEHMARLVADRVVQGRRVLAVVGVSHVVMQEDWLRSELACPPRASVPSRHWSQPPRFACDASCSPN